MAALRPLGLVLVCSVVGVASALAAPPSSAFFPVPAPAAAALLPGDPDATLRPVHWGRFCRWYPFHGLCLKLVIVRRFCDRHPDHRLCEDHDDRFCRRRPYHPRCDDKPPSPS